MTVSIYKNVADTAGKNVDLFTVLTTDKWQHLTNKVRAQTDKAKRDKLKQQLLPAFTPSGVFKENERTEAGLIQHSGYMCIDIDGDDNKYIADWKNVVHQLGKLPEVAFAGLSASGNGVFAIIPIKHPHRHKEHFKAFEESFKKRGLVIDPKCGNLSRLRFYSYNEHYHINRDAVPYQPLYKEPIEPKKVYTPMPPNSYSNEWDVEALVRQIATTGIDIVPSYEAWFDVAAALSNVHNGRNLFHTISQVNASAYNFKECNKQFDSVKPGKGITVNTLFHIAKQHGVELKRNQTTTNTFERGRPARGKKSKLFADWSMLSKKKKSDSKATQEQVAVVHPPTPQLLVCYVDKEGKLYISNPIGDETYTVYKTVAQYNQRKGLPTIINKSMVDTLQMQKRYINLSTLSILPQ